MKIAYITAGAGGMFCGSCLHDNTLARHLTRMGVDIQLIPTYTPIRTDEEDVSLDRVFFGGINVYLQQKLPVLRYVPNFLDRLLDSPRLLRWATSFGIETSANQLGALAVSMLQGTHGRQRKEVRRLAQWLAGSARPQLINLTNMLIAGCVPEMKRRIPVPVLVTLQGDDVFLEDLVEPYKTAAFKELRKLVPAVDGFVVFSRYYADYMSQYLEIPPERIHRVPLGLDTADFSPLLNRAPRVSEPPTIGYLARLAPEKGLHRLVEAFLLLKQQPGHERTRLRIAGWLGDGHRDFAEREFQRLRDAGHGDSFEYLGTVDRHQKLEFLGSIDVLSVPTVYREPKGLFVLEALAAGVPVVQPAHGAFPELVEQLGGGLLVEPENPAELARALGEILQDPVRRDALGRAGQVAVHRDRNGPAMAAATLEIYRQFVPC